MRMLPGSEVSLAGIEDTDMIRIKYAAVNAGSIRPFVNTAGRGNLDIQYEVVWDCGGPCLMHNCQLPIVNCQLAIDNLEYGGRSDAFAPVHGNALTNFGPKSLVTPNGSLRQTLIARRNFGFNGLMSGKGCPFAIQY